MRRRTIAPYYWVCPYCRRIRLRRRRRRRRFPSAAHAGVRNGASIDGPVSGLINIIIQVPVNAGDATALEKSHENSLSNAV